MKSRFIRSYFESFASIDGWFSANAPQKFMAYIQLLASHGQPGDVLGIGVHHGLSAIGVASLRGSGRHLYATLAYALRAGKAVVCTSYMHAVEALAGGAVSWLTRAAKSSWPLLCREFWETQRTANSW